MAGVAAVQAARFGGQGAVPNMMPAHKVGTDFLASSHFTISQDESVRQGTLKSVFKKDYIPWEINSKPPGANPPRPADILQKDDRYFNQKASETKQAYEYRTGDKAEQKESRHKLGATNFKMDSDPRLNSFQTTHNKDYTPKSGEGYFRGRGKDNPMQSYIPQGDREKAPEPLSDYRDRYRGHEGPAPEKVTGFHGGPPTIQGDSRQQHFNTTHNETYKGHRLPKLDAYPAPHGSSIPQGDVDKEVNMATTHQISFTQHTLPDRAYDKNAVMGKLQGTNFKQTDGHGAWNDYRSTMKESYKPLDGPIERVGPLCSRNQSDFPQGDQNPWSNAERANMTTNRFYMGNPPNTVRPKIESGADKRTKSQVCFGEPTLGDQFYETTTDSTFRPIAVPPIQKSSNLNTTSAVPLNYYDEVNDTTYKSDFYNPDADKMIPNPVAVEKLRSSHIHPPLGGQRWFSTEHQDQFTPKETNMLQVSDPGRLQRSSVPIGTLNK